MRSSVLQIFRSNQLDWQVTKPVVERGRFPIELFYFTKGLKNIKYICAYLLKRKLKNNIWNFGNYIELQRVMNTLD